MARPAADGTTNVSAALRRAIGAWLRTTVLAVPELHRERLAYDAFLANRSVSRLRGTAETSDGPTEWALIEKVTEGPSIASAYLYDNGLREYRAYESGLLDDLAPRLAAPAAYGRHDDEEGRLVLWLEDLDGNAGRGHGAAPDPDLAADAAAAAG